MKFEYKFVSVDDYITTDEFNKLGEDGWELVTIYESGNVQTLELNGNLFPMYVIDNRVAIFKRVV